MSAPRIQCNYDDLDHFARDFQHKAHEIIALKGHIVRMLDGLRGGGWTGVGAEAFFSEMADEVLPAVQRLSAALDTASQATAQVSHTFETAEHEAAALFQDLDMFGGAFAVGGAGVGTAPFGVNPVGYTSGADPAALRQQIEQTDFVLDTLLFSQGMLNSLGFDSTASELDDTVNALREQIEARRAGLALTLIDQIPGTDISEWGALSPAERVTVLENVHAAMADAYGFPTVPLRGDDFSGLGSMASSARGVYHSGSTPNIIGGQMVSVDPTGDPTDDFIVYNRIFETDNVPRGVEYIIHESRHVFQNRVAWNPTSDAYDYVPPDLAKAWKDNFQHYLPPTHADYKTQAIENDAYAIQNLFRRQLYGR